MASQKFTKVTLFFNCKLLYGGENKIFASKSEMVSKLTKISDGKKEINFINGRTVPFSKEFSMPFKWEEFPTYRDNPFNYPNYAVFTDGTINRTFGYFVTSSNTKNLPSDTVELFFKYDSFINNSDVIKNLKNKPIERYTMDGWIKSGTSVAYNNFTSDEFKPNTKISSIYAVNNLKNIWYKKDDASTPISKMYVQFFVAYLKYYVDETAEIKFDSRDIVSPTFSSIYPIKVVYFPFCVFDSNGRIYSDYEFLIPVKRVGSNYQPIYNGDEKVKYLFLYGKGNALTNIYFPSNGLKYLDSKCVKKVLTVEPFDISYFSDNDEGKNLLVPIDSNIYTITSINNEPYKYTGFFYDDSKNNTLYQEITTTAKYVMSKTYIQSVEQSGTEIEKILMSLGVMHVYPFSYSIFKFQNTKIPLTPRPSMTESKDINLARIYGKENIINYLLRLTKNDVSDMAIEISAEDTEPLPISQNAKELFLQANSNQIQNGILYARQEQITKNIENIGSGVFSGINAVSGAVVGNPFAVTSGIQNIFNSTMGIINEEIKINKLIDNNKAKLSDLENTNSKVSLNTTNSISRLVKEYLPRFENRICADEYIKETIAYFYNKYGIKYAGYLENPFSPNHINFDFIKFSDFDIAELNIQPNDERDEVYKMLIDGVRIWHNIINFGEENKYNKPVSFNTL